MSELRGVSRFITEDDDDDYDDVVFMEKNLTKKS
jgi:hypothetical protein